MVDVPEIEDVLPRQVVSELARIVLATETLDSVLSRVAELCTKTVHGADEVSVTLVRAGRAATAAYTHAMAMQADERQYGLDGGPCLDAGRGGQLMHVVDMRTEDRWPDYAPLAVKAGVLSSLSVPLPIQEEVVGAVNIYARKPDAFDDEAIAAGRAFAAYAAIAVSNADTYVSTAELAKNLQIAMESRAVIEQAKGLIMASDHCSPDEAFDVLVKASQRENVKLRVLAERIVAAAQIPSS